MGRGDRGGAGEERHAEWSGTATHGDWLPLCVLVWCGRAWRRAAADARPEESSDAEQDRRLAEPPREKAHVRGAAEDALLAELARGDERALEALYLAHERRLHRVAYRYLHSAWTARAVVQDVFASIWYRRASLVVTGSIEAYLVAAVRKRALTVLREELRRRQRDERWGASDSGSDGMDADAAVEARESEQRAARGPAVVALAANSSPDIRALIARVLAELPERQRIVFRLRVERRLTNAEVQTAIGAVSIKAVEMLYSRAIKALRTRCPGAQPPCREGTRRSAET